MAPSYDPRDDLDAPPDDLDPVVRLPKRMVSLPPPAPGPGLRTVLAVGLIGAALGASLGAVGIGIVYATQLPPVAVVRHRRPVARRPEAPVSLNLDAGTQAPVVPQPPRFESRQQSLGRGRTLAAVLHQLGLSRDEPLRVTNALRMFVNMRALQPTDVVCAMRDPVSHDLRRVEYRRSDTLVWAAVHDERGWTAERVEVTRTTVRMVAAFRVARGSVETSVRAVGLNPEIIPKLGDVFVAIALTPRLHGGDVVRLVVDEERLNGEFFRYGRILAVDYQGAVGRRRAYWVGASGRSGDYYDASGQTFERGPLHSPVPGARISSRFDPHRMHPVLHVVKPHNGVDFAAPTGTPVYAAAEGTVASVGPAGPSGNLVRLTHSSLGVETGYAHLSRFAAGLHGGQRVRVSQLIGYIGTTGRSTGPHLHFSVKRAGVFLDPMTLYGSRHPVPPSLHSGFESSSGLLGADLERAVVDGPATANGAAPSEPAAAEIPDGGAMPEEPPSDETTEDEDDAVDERDRPQ